MSPAARKNLTVLAVVVVAVAVAAFVLLKPSDDESAPTRPATTIEAPPAPKPRPEPLVIRTAGGAPIGEPTKIEVGKGDTVRIDVTSDVAEKVHVHGYDLEVAVPAGGHGKVQFPASIDGRFEIELHGSGAPIAELTVNP